MALEMKTSLGICVTLVLFISQNYVLGEPLVPCYFIFGDSLADNGNNNNLPTLAKSNYAPYGIDFPGGTPTGRFTNGRTTCDIIGEFLGFDKFIPTFTTAIGTGDILRGVNYASGSAGIRDETGLQLGAHVSLNRQILNHKIALSHMAAIKKRKGLPNLYLNKCLYAVGMGSNDYINNYFVPEFYSTSRLFTPEQYSVALIQQYSRQLKALYTLGARKSVIFGVGLIGCTPAAISRFGTNGAPCVDKLNMAAELFNNKLVSLIDQLNGGLKDANFIYINSTAMGSGDPSAAGFTVANVGCCQVNSSGLCIPGSVPCPNRNQFVFWDSFHPTEALNLINAVRSFNASIPFDTYPMDIQSLIKL